MISSSFYGNPALDSDCTQWIGSVLSLDVINGLPDSDNHRKSVDNELPADFINAIVTRLHLTGQKRGEFLECHCPIHPPDESPSAGWHPEKHLLSLWQMPASPPDGSSLFWKSLMITQHLPNLSNDYSDISSQVNNRPYFAFFGAGG